MCVPFIHGIDNIKSFQNLEQFIPLLCLFKQSFKYTHNITNHSSFTAKKKQTNTRLFASTYPISIINILCTCLKRVVSFHLYLPLKKKCAEGDPFITRWCRFITTRSSTRPLKCNQIAKNHFFHYHNLNSFIVIIMYPL